MTLDDIYFNHQLKQIRPLVRARIMLQDQEMEMRWLKLYCAVLEHAIDDGLEFFGNKTGG